MAKTFGYVACALLALSSVARAYPTIDLILNAHNYAREDKSVAPLVYDSGLASAAQKYANLCKGLVHSGNSSMGENLSIWSSTASKAGDLDEGLKGPGQWVDEYKYYNCPANTGNGTIGHYTQVMWSNSNKVGCGMTWCNINSPWGTQYPYYWMYVCNYSPPGNYQGQRAFPATQCNTKVPCRPTTSCQLKGQTSGTLNDGCKTLTCGSGPATVAAATSGPATVAATVATTGPATTTTRATTATTAATTGPATTTRSTTATTGPATTTRATTATTATTASTRATTATTATTASTRATTATTATTASTRATTATTATTASTRATTATTATTGPATTTRSTTATTGPATTTRATTATTATTGPATTTRSTTATTGAASSSTVSTTGPAPTCSLQRSISINQTQKKTTVVLINNGGLPIKKLPVTLSGPVTAVTGMTRQGTTSTYDVDSLPIAPGTNRTVTYSYSANPGPSLAPASGWGCW
eukprot:TRINITY_DN7175_c0_g1_i1.p1 TRINITY_DN7175_c0_g1~~TRINITY_DN7175_c0_g1_i1.p1  ORF type:complete len:478 (+),score=76.07 TRINITY_DN7175_c0_g1_i1:86-1519(+)